MTTNVPTNLDDMIDSHDIIEALEPLEDMDAIRADLEDFDTDYPADGSWDDDTCRAAWLDHHDLTTLAEFARWGEAYAPDWEYGATFIRWSFFVEYARELAYDIGAVDSNAEWPTRCIDWEMAADELRQDYTSIAFDGIEYLTHV